MTRATGWYRWDCAARASTRASTSLRTLRMQPPLAAVAKGPKTSAGEHGCGRAAPRPPLLGRAEEQPSSAAPAAASKTRTQAGTVQRAASGGCVRKVKRKIEARVEVRFDMRWQCRRVARDMTEVPPAAPRRQRAVRAARCVTRAPAPGTSAVEQRRTRAEPAQKASGGDDARRTTGWPARPFFVNYPHPPERQTSRGRNRSYSAAGAVLSLIEPSGSLDRGAFSAHEARVCWQKEARDQRDAAAAKSAAPGESRSALLRRQHSRARH